MLTGGRCLGHEQRIRSQEERIWHRPNSTPHCTVQIVLSSPLWKASYIFNRRVSAQQSHYQHRHTILTINSTSIITVWNTETNKSEFDVFSTVHHSIELFHQPTLMHNFLYSLTICLLHYYPQHASSINMPIFRRKNCIHTASGIFDLCKRLHSTLETCRG